MKNFTIVSVKNHVGVHVGYRIHERVTGEGLCIVWPELFQNKNAAKLYLMRTIKK